MNADYMACDISDIHLGYVIFYYVLFYFILFCDILTMFENVFGMFVNIIKCS